MNGARARPKIGHWAKSVVTTILIGGGIALLSSARAFASSDGCYYNFATPPVWICGNSAIPVGDTQWSPSTTTTSSTTDTTSGSNSTSGAPSNNSTASTTGNSTYTWTPHSGDQDPLTQQISTTTSGFNADGSSGEAGGYTYNSCAGKTGGVAAYNPTTGVAYCTNAGQGCPSGEHQVNGDGVCQEGSGNYAQWTFSACVNGTQTEYSHNTQTGAVTSTSQISCVSGSSSPSQPSSGSGSTGGGYTGGGYVPPTHSYAPSCQSAPTSIHISSVSTNGTIVTVRGSGLPTLTGQAPVTYGDDYGNFLWSQSSSPMSTTGEAVGNAFPYSPDWGIHVLQSSSTELQFIPADNNGQAMNSPSGTWYLYLMPAGDDITGSQCAVWNGIPNTAPACPSGEHEATQTTYTTTACVPNVTVTTHDLTTTALAECMPDPLITTYNGQTIQPPTNDQWVTQGGAIPNTLLPGPGWGIQGTTTTQVTNTCQGSGSNQTCTTTTKVLHTTYQESYDPAQCPYPVVAVQTIQ